MMKDFLEIMYRQKGKDCLNHQKHIHADEYEIIQTWTDDGNVIICNKIYPMSRGAVFFIYANDVHSTNPFNPEQYERNKVIVSAHFLDALAEIGDFRSFIDQKFRTNGGTCLVPEVDQAQALDEIFRTMVQVQDEKGEFQKAELISLLLSLLQHTEQWEKRFSNTTDKRVLRVLDYIESHLENSISIEELCKTANVSRYYLCHLFKKSVGMTVSQYIVQRRLGLARKMLLTMDISISEIAMACGFSSFSYFSRIFHEVEGCPPRVFRDRGKKPRKE